MLINRQEILFLFQPFARLLFDHFLKVIDTFRAHVHGVLEGLEVLEEITLDFSDACAEPTDEALHCLDDVVHVLHVAWKVRGDELQGG